MITSDDRTFRVSPAELRDETGWDLKPEGLCKGDVCVPVRGRDDLVVDGRVDVRVLAEVLRLPLAIDEDAGVAVLGESAVARAAQREALQVDDFTLTDVDGSSTRWSSFGRKKKLLVTWASW
jgi:hypothetical protein